MLYTSIDKYLYSKIIRSSTKKDNFLKFTNSEQILNYNDIATTDIIATSTAFDYYYFENVAEDTTTTTSKSKSKPKPYKFDQTDFSNIVKDSIQLPKGEKLTNSDPKKQFETGYLTIYYGNDTTNLEYNESNAIDRMIYNNYDAYILDTPPAKRYMKFLERCAYSIKDNAIPIIAFKLNKELVEIMILKIIDELNNPSGSTSKIAQIITNTTDAIKNSDINKELREELIEIFEIMKEDSQKQIIQEKIKYLVKTFMMREINIEAIKLTKDILEQKITQPINNLLENKKGANKINVKELDSISKNSIDKEIIAEGKKFNSNIVQLTNSIANLEEILDQPQINVNYLQIVVLIQVELTRLRVI